MSPWIGRGSGVMFLRCILHLLSIGAVRHLRPWAVAFAPRLANCPASSTAPPSLRHAISTCMDQMAEQSRATGIELWVVDRPTLTDKLPVSCDHVFFSFFGFPSLFSLTHPRLRGRRADGASVPRQTFPAARLAPIATCCLAHPIRCRGTNGRGARQGCITIEIHEPMAPSFHEMAARGCKRAFLAQPIDCASPL